MTENKIPKIQSLWVYALGIYIARMEMPKPRILIFADYYLPGYRAGGPVKSISHIVNKLLACFNFTIVTRNHDLSETAPYSLVALETLKTSGISILHLDTSRKFIKTLYSFLKHNEADILYLNSFFSFYFSIIPYCLYKLILRQRAELIIAPRGEFSAGALNIKAVKKKLFCIFVKLFGIQKRVIWHVTSENEKTDIGKIMGTDIKTFLAPNISEQVTIQINNSKKPGIVKIIFLSRISRKKNLDYALKILSNVKGNVHFDIYGTKEDPDYWLECEQLIKTLPGNIQASYCGESNPKDVCQVISQYDLFFLPTHGENFGHAILESLTAGCPILISDLTPWDQLEQFQAGWAFPLTQATLFINKIEELIPFSLEQYQKLHNGAQHYAQDHFEKSSAIDATKAMFISALNKMDKTHAK